MSFGWTCSNCTYQHHAPCERCVMCNVLKVTPQQMANFVLGVPIPKPLPPAHPTSSNKPSNQQQATLDAVVILGAATASRPMSQNTGSETTTSTRHAATTAKPKAVALTHNPYAKKRPAPAMGNHNSQQSPAPAISTAAAVSRSSGNASAAIGTGAGERPTALLSEAQQSTVLTIGSTTWGATAAAAADNHFSASNSGRLPFEYVSGTRAAQYSKPPPFDGAAAGVDASVASLTGRSSVAGLKVPPPSPHNDNNGATASSTRQPSTIENADANAAQRSGLVKYHRPGIALQAKSAIAPASKVTANTKDTGKTRQYGPARIPYKAGPVPIDPTTASDWIYPKDSPEYPTRMYQLEMSETAIFHNTLVSLPTGLGKTLIAAVVMYNYHRWFPTGKVVFMAPTLPLVQQQIKACYQIMGIPANATAMLTGKVSQDKRLGIWRDRSVFFCTPQTVQKDLESGSCPAQDVVCVVLDEAHRAAGNYAYVNVVQYLEQSGAKFRVLGLSATPGANIKAIQKVVDVLGINRIEARNESDPSIAEHTHTRTSEIIVVPQIAASKGIELSLNAIIDPLLARLRNAGFFQRFGVNSSISCYNIIKESDAYKERTHQDPSLSGFFFAAQKFVQIRDHLHKQGVGMVRTKINELRLGRPTGIVSKIVKGPDFAKLWEEVSRATCDPNAHQTDARDRLHNNPKLAKLCEILKEHFERSRACSKSSRAIVFSQFRDSVSEIVSVLEPHKPIIRSRHFIGQGKGTKGKNDDVNQNQQLQGMNQTEQHTVIREFRNDVYNVLVCTCIGEEGLDIGEVDLIVNFDTLSSPIRSLQRIGRTGRKREGRVVCLVSEGAEEKTMNSSKQKERTLQHALKNPKAFTTRPSAPMLEVEPTLTRMVVQLSQNFRESQVEGIGRANRKDADKPMTAISTRWKLTGIEDAQRLSTLRQYTRVHLSFEAAGMMNLRRRFLAGRAMKMTSTFKKENFTGNVAEVLRKTEATNDTLGDVLPKKSRSRGFRDGNDEAIDVLFPLIACASEYIETFKGASTCTVSEIDVETFTKPASAAVLAATSFALAENYTLPTKPLDLKSCPRGSNQGPVPTRPIFGGGSDQHEYTKPAIYVFNESVGQEHFDEFCLPTPPDSGSSDDEDDYDMEDIPPSECISQRAELVADVADQVEGVLVEQSKADSGRVAHKSSELLASPMAKSDVIHDEFCLPSPASSSDESDNESEPASNGKKIITIDETGNAAAQKQVSPMWDLVANPSEEGISELPTSPSRVRFSDAAEDGPPLNNCTFQYSQGSEASFQPLVKKPKGNLKVIQDLPETAPKIVNPYASRKRKSLGSLSCDLTNTQDDLMDTQYSSSRLDNADDVVCSICLSGNSPDEDPIILCDGERAPGQSCDLAVHATCYSVHISLQSDEDWFCDPCMFRKTGFTGSFECSDCKGGEDAGGLKQTGNGGLWRHVKCHGNSRGPQRLRKLGMPPVHPKVTKEPGRHPLEPIALNAFSPGGDDFQVRKRRRQEHLRRFVQEEADCESSEDDEEDDDVRAIEEEEALAAEGFINDATQLDYTQDELDRLDPGADNENLHRELDLERARRDEFATPCLGRRFLRKTGLSADTPQSAPSSEKGLGKMHFIRSILEHHRQGGDADDIEHVFNELEAAGTQVDLSDSTE